MDKTKVSKGVLEKGTMESTTKDHEVRAAKAVCQERPF